MIVRFLVEIARVARAGFVNRGVKALRRQAPALNHQFPRPLDRFFLEVIAEAPVPEHLEEGVVIGVEPDVVEVVVLAAGADAFLGVGRARRLPGRALLAEENGHELVHARVREKQIRRIRQERRRRDDGVLFLAKEIEKGLADLGGGHFAEGDVSAVPQDFITAHGCFGPGKSFGLTNYFPRRRFVT